MLMKMYHGTSWYICLDMVKVLICTGSQYDALTLIYIHKYTGFGTICIRFLKTTLLCGSLSEYKRVETKTFNLYQMSVFCFFVQTVLHNQ